MMINGKGYWFKAAGKPRVNKYSNKEQWSFDLSITEDTQKSLLDKGMRKNYLRNKDDERGTFLTFVRDAVKQDGTDGKPFKIIDAHGNPWPEGKLVGNGSELNVVVTLNEREFNKQKFLKPSAVAVQVWNLVEYESGKFPTKELSDEVIQDPAPTGTENW